MKISLLRLKARLGRLGVRARLLTLLLPGIAVLLALDSSNDYQALQRVVNDAYDEAMLDSEIALRRSVSLSKNGLLQLDESFADREMLSSAPAWRHKYFHIGLTPHQPDARNLTAPRAQKTLLGHGDLPPLPPEFSAAAWPLPAARPALVWYGGVYRGNALRIVASRSLVADEQGQAFELLVQVAEDQALRDQAQAPSLQQALARDARMFVLVIVLVWLGIAWSLQPLEQLRVSVLRSRGAALAPLDISGVPHEVAPLVHAINGQIARYAALLARQTQFLTDASHQLKTPLAIMMTQAEVALREKDPALLRPTLHAIVAQILRSTRLCQQLLSLAHANDQPPSEPGVVDLNAIAKDVVLQHLALAHEKNQDLGWIDARDAIPPTGLSRQDALFGGGHQGCTVPVLACGAEVYEALANLVHNAIAHTPANGHITVAASISGAVAIAEVIDNGPGIALAQRAAVFERFHTGASAKTARHGTGLGLAIARAYARRNGGEIHLADTLRHGQREPGLTAALHFPTAQRPAAAPTDRD